MSARGRGPLWTRGAPRRDRPFWAKQRPWGRGGPWWLRPHRDGGTTRAGGGDANLADAGRWIAVRAAAALAVVIALAATAGFLLQRADGGPIASWARSTGHDALWMGGAWVTGHRSPADVRHIAARVQASGISDVYVFTGSLDGAGRLSPAGYAGAGSFLAAFHGALPKVRVSAWIGGVIGGSHIDLGDQTTRANIVAAAAALLRAGFGGVHYDLEPVDSGDPGLLALLDRTRALHPDPLSVAVPKLEPLPGLRIPARLITGRPVFWTAGYLTDVASRVNQVAIRDYNTGMPFRSWYGGYVEHQTALALRAVPGNVGLLMGLPAFSGDDFGHHAAAETVAAAIHGIRVAVTAAGRSGTAHAGNQGQRPFGVALFADYSATSADWASYQRDWVRPGSSV